LKKRFDVKILGQVFSVLSDSGDDHVADVIRYVGDKVEEAGKAAGSGNALNVALLAALNIADEHLRMMEAKESICSQLESRSERLISLINDNKTD
jgi:cell division protein ZapA